MRYLLLISHGTFAPGLHSVLDMLVGKRDDILSTSMEDGMGADVFVENLKQTITHIEYNGVGQVKVEDLYRVEVEFKDVDKVLPFTMLTDRDSYFAGANPFCASLLPGAVERKVMGLPDFNPKAAAAAHCPGLTDSTPARTISAIDAEVKSVSPSQRVRNSGVIAAPPRMAHPRPEPAPSHGRRLI